MRRRLLTNPLGIRKFLLYLDTCFVRNLSRDLDDDLNRELGETLRKAVERHVVVCPTGSSHKIESEPMFRDRRQFRDMAHRLSRGVRFRLEEEVSEKQLMRVFYPFLSRSRLLARRDWQEAFLSNPDSAPNSGWNIRAEFPLFPWEKAAINSSEAGYIATITHRPKLAVPFEVAYADEAFVLRNVLLQGTGLTHLRGRLDLAKLLNAPEMPNGVYRRFFSPETIVSVPYLDILARLSAGIRSYFPNRKADGNDVEDMRALALAAPYCDVIATDKFWSALDERPSVGIQTNYGVKLIAPTRSGIRDLIAILEGLLKSAPVPASN
jgi:hypothetical protein